MHATQYSAGCEYYILRHILFYILNYLVLMIIDTYCTYAVIMIVALHVDEPLGLGCASFAVDE